MLETAILGVLSDGSLHGYELKKRITDVIGPWSSVSFGSLYPALSRLERAGHVVVDDAVAPAAPPKPSLGAEVAAFRARTRSRSGSPSPRARKVYSITDGGSSRLADLLDDPDGDDRSFAVRVAFCRHLSPERRISLFEARLRSLDHMADERRGRTARRGAAPCPTDELDRYRRSLVAFQNERAQRERAWLEELLKSERAALHPAPDSLDPAVADVAASPSGGTST